MLILLLLFSGNAAQYQNCLLYKSFYLAYSFDYGL